MGGVRITFITPPSLDGSGKDVERVFGCTYDMYPFPHIFLLTAAALLEREGFLVSYVDAPRMGWGKQQFQDFLQDDTSDLYVVYSVNLSTCTDLAAMELIGKASNDALVVFLGPAPTLNPGDFLKSRNTAVVRGEFEAALLEVAQAVMSGQTLAGIPSLSIKENGDLTHGPPREVLDDLDSLPFPARHLIDSEKYFNPKLALRPVTAVLTSRGCSYPCLFCVPNSQSFARELEYRRYFGKKPPVVKRSVEDIVAEFRQLKEGGYRAVSVIDDQFVWGTDRTIAVCKGIEDLGLRWGCLARADHLSERVVEAMADAGCDYVDIGVESFDQNVLDYVKKQLRVDAIEGAVTLLKKHGILAKINVLFGASPLEDEESVRLAMKKISAMDPDAVMYRICCPYPGTEWYEIAERKNWLKGGEYEPVDIGKISTVDLPNISAKRLEQLTRKANLQFYLRPHFWRKNWRRVLAPKELYSTLVALYRKFF